VSDLFVVTFDDETRAAQALDSVKQLQAADQLDLDDAVIAVKSERGRVRIQQTVDPSTETTTISGGWWGLLIGLLLGGPIGGLVGGLAAGAVLGRLIDLGVDDAFIKDVGRRLDPGSAALFVLVKGGDTDALHAMLERSGGAILKTELSDAARQMLADTASGAAGDAGE